MNEYTEVLKYLSAKIEPCRLTEKGKSKVSNMLKDFSKEDIIRAIDISVEQYLEYENEEPTIKSVNKVIDKIGGIAHNLSLPAIEKEFTRIYNIGNRELVGWTNKDAKQVLNTYVDILKKYWNEEQIVKDLHIRVVELIYSLDDFNHWKNQMLLWIDNIIKTDGQNT